MKLKVSLDSRSIKQFFVDHVEKILFGVVVVVFLLFVYKAVARNKLDWQPQDLVQDAEQAKKRIQETQPSPIPIREFTKEAARIRQPIAESDYTFKVAWDPLIFAENVPRGLPVLFPIKDLRASAGNGAFAMAPEDEEEEEESMSTTRGQRWVVLTGLIEHRKQKEAYDTAFQEAAQWDPQRDYPDYVFYRVERAEVDPRVETAELKWTPIHVMNMLALQDLWLQPGVELVDPMYLPPPRGSVTLAYPLGPLQNRQWGPEVAHPPEIPLSEGPVSTMAASGMPGMDMYGGMMTGKKKAPAAGKGGKAEVEETEEEAAKRIEAEKKARAERRKKARQKLMQQPDEPDVFDTAAGGAAGGMAMPGAEMYGMSTTPRRRVPGGMPMGMPGGSMPGAMPGMGSSGMYPTMPGMRGARRRPGLEEEETTEEVQEVEHLLFRFFDFTVQPGKHYRYRVKLVLANPNYGMLPHFLEKEGMEKVKTLEAEWSDPSPSVTVPLDSQVLAVSARASDGTATVMLVRFEEKDGAAAAEEFATVARGQFLNYLDRPFPESAMPGVMPTMGSAAYPGMMGPMGMPYAPGAAAKSEDAPERKVNYVTNALLLDVMGGGRLPGKDRSLVEPGSILLLDAEGKLVVRNELDDLPEYQFHKPPEKQEVAGAGQPKGRGRKAAGPGSTSDAMAEYAAQMMGMMPPGTPQPKKGKGSKAGGTSTGLPPGMTPGMSGAVSGSPSMGMESLDDARSKRKKKGR